MAERTPHERETLIFPSVEQAQKFRERVEGRLSRERRPNVRREREVVGQEVAAEFAAEQEPASALQTPWEHTAEEHREVQQLVNTAFAKDLRAALHKARGSNHYPRNLDLLHDVLTGEMYRLLQQRGINRQPLFGWLLAIGAIAPIVLVLIFLLFIA